jgi:hypothetical protein
MDNLLGEHGEALVYAIIGVIVVIVICYVCENKWKDITPEYKTAISKNNSSFINSNKYNYPVIEADETIYVEYETNNFSCIDFIKATDCNGKDITDKQKRNL